MDFLTVYFTSGLTHAKTTFLRMLAASVLGAVYGTAALIFSVNGILSWFCSAGVSVLMSLAAFGKQGSLSGLLRQSVMIWGCGALIGGTMSAFMSMGEPVYFGSGENVSFPKYYILTFAAVLVFIRIAVSRKNREYAAVEVEVSGENIRFTALADSGNLLRDPLGGSPVVLAAAELFGSGIRNSLAGFPDSCEGLRIRVIPQKTVCGEGILYGFVPDRIRVDGVERRAVVALDEKGHINGYGGYSGIVPMCLCGAGGRTAG